MNTTLDPSPDRDAAAMASALRHQGQETLARLVETSVRVRRQIESAEPGTGRILPPAASDAKAMSEIAELGRRWLAQIGEGNPPRAEEVLDAMRKWIEAATARQATR